MPAAGPAILSRTGLTVEGVEVTVADIDRILREVASAGDRFNAVTEMLPELARERAGEAAQRCLLYTSDAADEQCMV